MGKLAELAAQLAMAHLRECLWDFRYEVRLLIRRTFFHLRCGGVDEPGYLCRLCFLQRIEWDHLARCAWRVEGR